METIDFGVDIDACRKNFEAREAQRRLEGERLRQTARQAFWAAIETALPHYPDVKRVYLFGSVTREGAFQRASDIDVAVEGTNAKQYFSLWRELDEATPGWFIDLREINQPSYFSKAIRQRGELVYERQDPGVKG